MFVIRGIRPDGSVVFWRKVTGANKAHVAWVDEFDVKCIYTNKWQAVAALNRWLAKGKSKLSPDRTREEVLVARNFREVEVMEAAPFLMGLEQERPQDERPIRLLDL